MRKNKRKKLSRNTREGLESTVFVDPLPATKKKEQSFIYQKKEAIPPGYAPYAYTLLIEHRSCECCGSEHEVPSLGLRVLLVNNKGAKLTIGVDFFSSIYQDLRKEVQVGIPTPLLPRLIEHVHTSIAFCQNCFTETAEEQEDLFAPEGSRRALSLETVCRHVETALAYKDKYKQPAENLEQLLAFAYEQKAGKPKPAPKKAAAPVKPLDISTLL